MSHSCRALLCETPHYAECSCDKCEFCHETHSWRDWNVYPECWRCEEEMYEEIQPLLDEYPARHKTGADVALAHIPAGVLPAKTVWGQGPILNENWGGLK